MIAQDITMNGVQQQSAFRAREEESLVRVLASWVMTNMEKALPLPVSKIKAKSCRQEIDLMKIIQLGTQQIH